MEMADPKQTTHIHRLDPLFLRLHRYTDLVGVSGKSSDRRARSCTKHTLRQGFEAIEETPEPSDALVGEYERKEP